ncbi:flagellar biosynthesis protein FlhB [Candidatus Margulisiibacteriota bacterium]
MGEDSGEKTEEPTPHKLREARKKGQIAKSKDITSALMVFVAFFTFSFLAKYMWFNLLKVAKLAYDHIPMEFNVSIVGNLLGEVLKIFILTLLPLFVVNFFAAIIIENMQTGFLFALSAIEPKLNKLNPIEGAKKFFSLKQWVELAKSLIKMSVVVYLIFSVLRNEFLFVLLAQQLTLWQIMQFTASLIMKIIIRVGIFYVIVALFDYIYQKYEYMKSMKMSKKEIKDEYKRLEGDPMIKQRQREASRQLAQGRQMGAVPGAEVVVTNPIHLAIAIAYKPEKMNAPKVVAKGRRLIAEEIKRIAEEYHVPIIEDPPLAQKLFKASEVDMEVPPEFYRILAEILAFVYNLRKKRKSV